MTESVRIKGLCKAFDNAENPDKPVLAVPAMNVRMWQHASVQRNAAWLAE